MPESENTGAAAGINARNVIDGVVSGDQRQGMVDTMLACLPAQFQAHDEIQVMIGEMRQAENRYLPLARDLHQSSLGNDVQRHLPRMMGSLFLVGLIACLSLAAGLIAMLAAVLVFGVYLAVRGRVIYELRQEAGTGREALVKSWQRLSTLEKQWLEQERTA